MTDYERLQKEISAAHTTFYNVFKHWYRNKWTNNPAAEFGYVMTQFKETEQMIIHWTNRLNALTQKTELTSDVNSGPEEKK